MSKDRELRDRAQIVIPGGMYGHQKADWLPPAYPQYFERSEGTRLWDVDGNCYIDYMCGYGINLFGYGERSIDEAARKQAALCDGMTGPAPVIVELAEKLVSMISHADWAMFCKNGTDANSIAMVCARAYANKRKVLIAKGTYHGSAPWCTPIEEGITPEDRANNVYFEYNNLESLRTAFKQHEGDVAGVFATPFRHEILEDQFDATAEYAREVRRLCDEHDALLIVDEVRTGFRLARGSSWDALGVKPDLSSWGKVLANGYPISAVVGSEKARTAASRIFVTGSYWFSAVPMAAALQTLKLIETTDYLEASVTLGQALRSGIQEQAERYGFDLHQTGPVQMPQILFANDKEMKLGFAWTQAVLRRGVYLHPFHNMFFNAAMTRADIAETLEATEASFKEVLNDASRLQPVAEKT
ncbi:aminotransferase class III-fold pyridoxal phosphate-dependent enzyme [Paraburkholderia megapolitana]|uniref:aminotransferase class III-fold pyridoxal phosphate-dependent enzyme n=1 Tax=Paraburkholderia megapolitana TaxID=420953 RepID=UPI0038BB8975